MGPPGRGAAVAVLVGLLLAACGAAEVGSSALCADKGLDLRHPAVAEKMTVKKHMVAQQCLLYRRVCFDQGAIISFDPAHSPANFSAKPIPRLDITKLQYIWAGHEGSMNSDVLPLSWATYAPLDFRPTSRLEGSPDLQQPRFNNCTVPMVMWSLWVHNYAEFWMRLPTRLWALQQAGAMSNRTTLVVGMPAGERAPQYASTLLQPFTPHRVVSFAEFSQRLAPGEERDRCFERAYLCSFAVPHGGTAMLSAGQAIARYYEQQGVLPQNPLHFDSAPDVLKVIIERRAGPVRDLLNAAELVQQCNSAGTSWRLDATSPIKRVQCRPASFGGDTERNILAARSADVLLTVHGAGAMNWLAMRPGSALLELRPYQFGSRGWADGYFHGMVEGQKNQVFWYGINVEDPSVSKPGAIEATHNSSGPNPRFNRDRHTTLPFSALREMLRRVAAAGRDRDRYLRQKAEGQHYVELLPGEVLRPRGRPARAGGPAGLAAAAKAGVAANAAAQAEAAAAATEAAAAASAAVELEAGAAEAGAAEAGAAALPGAQAAAGQAGEAKGLGAEGLAAGAGLKPAAAGSAGVHQAGTASAATAAAAAAAAASAPGGARTAPAAAQHAGHVGLRRLGLLGGSERGASSGAGRSWASVSPVLVMAGLGCLLLYAWLRLGALKGRRAHHLLPVKPP